MDGLHRLNVRVYGWIRGKVHDVERSIGAPSVTTVNPEEKRF